MVYTSRRASTCQLDERLLINTVFSLLSSKFTSAVLSTLKSKKCVHTYLRRFVCLMSACLSACWQACFKGCGRILIFLKKIKRWRVVYETINCREAIGVRIYIGIRKWRFVLAERLRLITEIASYVVGQFSCQQIYTAENLL